MEINLRPTYKQHLVYEALRNNTVDSGKPVVDFVFFGGGAGGGKSWCICESRLVNALRFPGYKSFIGRKELKRLMQSTFLTFQKVCVFHKIPADMWKLNGQYNYVSFYNGSRIDLLDVDMLPSDPLYERFGSLEYTDGALEEAGEINFAAFDILKTRIGRHMNKESGIRPTLLITGNPKKNWTYSEFYKPSREGTLAANKVFIQSLYSDNPYTANEYGKQLAEVRDRATKERLMYGNWEYDDDPSALIDYDAIVDLFSNAVVDSPQKFLICDVARFGDDKTTISIWEGYKAVKLEEYTKLGTDKVALIIRNFATMFQIPYSHILVDEDGVGGGVMDQLAGSKGFVANSAALPNIKTFEKDNYRNLKSQCGFKLAEMINSHQICVSALNLAIKERLIEELEQIKAYNRDKDSRLELLPKEKVKELIGRSPDWSDNLLMRMWFEVNPAVLISPAKIWIPKNLKR